jgi:hypothetical protein
LIEWPIRIKDTISWILLLRISQSFVSKIFTGISLSVFFLSHTEQFAFFRNVDLTFKVMMCGGLAFLIGYVVVAVYVPSEFRETMSVNDAVVRQKNIEYYRSFVNRIDMLESMIARTNKDFPPDLSRDPLQFAEISVKRARESTSENWKETSAALYLADLNLRQYDNFSGRMLALICLTIGLMSSVYSTVFGLLQVLSGWHS